VYDLETKNKAVYPTKVETAKALGVSSRTLTKYFNDATGKVNTPYKGRYIMKKLVCNHHTAVNANLVFPPSKFLPNHPH